MKRCRKNRRLAECALSAEDRKSLRQSKRSFYLIFLLTNILISLTIGIAVPITQDQIHRREVAGSLREALIRAENYNWKQDDGDVETFPVESFFICQIDTSGLDDGKLDIEDVVWEIGSENIYDLLLNDAATLDSVLSSESLSFGNYQFMTKESDGKTFIAGIDSSEYRLSLTWGTVLLETLLAVSFVIISGFALFLTDLIFKPVVNSMTAQRKFVGDASHELKTPLAVIKANTDLLLDGKDPASPDVKWLKSIQDESDRMSTTIMDLITISSLESSFHLQKVEDMSRIVNDVALSFDAICFEKGIYYTVGRIDQGVRVNCSTEDTRKLLEELFGNAVKYAEGTPPKIDVSFELRKSSAIFTITNTGCTIAPDQSERVFDRFYRTPQMRASGRAGSGLGLSICKSICEKNKFTIECIPDTGHSTTFKVEMPLS